MYHPVYASHSMTIRALTNLLRFGFLQPKTVRYRILADVPCYRQDAFTSFSIFSFIRAAPACSPFILSEPLPRTRLADGIIHGILSSLLVPFLHEHIYYFRSSVSHTAFCPTPNCIHSLLTQLLHQLSSHRQLPYVYHVPHSFPT
jgi:hypothetical protein